MTERYGPDGVRAPVQGVLDPTGLRRGHAVDGHLDLALHGRLSGDTLDDTADQQRAFAAGAAVLAVTADGVLGKSPVSEDLPCLVLREYAVAGSRECT
ncbi:hypothetical protein ABZ208_10695 [Streptomyces sp. NPDC006208]|uniref:hypothetical protein n=1 Tax=Streptomyces sp. NPDC006208 TaxID=3156734 RepID=UPI0033A281FE